MVVFCDCDVIVRKCSGETSWKSPGWWRRMFKVSSNVAEFIETKTCLLSFFPSPATSAAAHWRYRNIWCRGARHFQTSPPLSETTTRLTVKKSQISESGLLSLWFELFCCRETCFQMFICSEVQIWSLSLVHACLSGINGNCCCVCAGPDKNDITLE